MGSTTKVFGALAGSLALAGSSMAFVTPFAVAAENSGSAEMQQEEAVENGAVDAASVSSVSCVEGSFSYNQNAMIPSSVFNKAASAVCASLPEYGIEAARHAIQVNCQESGTSFEATVSEMSEEEGAVTLLMGCSCSSNVAGGGAIMNAEVTGIAFYAVADAANAL